MKFIFAFLYLTVSAFAATLVIPNQSVNGWQPSATIGIAGGIPAKIAARTVLLNVVSAYGADPTGAASCHTAVNAAILDAANVNKVVYFPYGVYKFTVGAQFSNYSNFTFRGAGMGVSSSSSNTIGTGAKTFTVAAGLGWTAGVGCRVWIRNTDPKWMQGTVTSYSGTSLVLNITSTSGDTDTSSSWTVSQTHLDLQTPSGGIFNYSTANFDEGETAITGSPGTGVTVLTVASGAGLAVGRLAEIKMRDTTEIYNNSGFKYSRTLLTRITAIVGNSVTIETPLYYALPVAYGPTIASFGSFPNVSGIGYEDFSCTGNSSNGDPLVQNNRVYASWIWKVRAAITKGYMLQTANSLRCEIAYSVGAWRTQGGSSGSSVLTEATTACLYRHVVMHDAGAAVLAGGSSCGDAWLYCYAPGAGMLMSHNPHSSYLLFESCAPAYFHNDGNFGGAAYNTIHRSWMIGNDAGGLNGFGFVVLNRWQRYNNLVGITLGQPGVATGDVSYGNPNIGNGSSFGTSNSITGPQALHLNADGNSRIIGTVASSSGASTATITLTSGNTLADLSSPFTSNDVWPFYLCWGTNQSLTVRKCTIDRGASSGTSIVFNNLGDSAFDTFPAAGTTNVSIYCGYVGSQERDEAVEYSTFKKANFKALAGGGGSMTDPLPGGTTLANSLSETGTPSDWPVGLAWPPPIDSIAPSYNPQSLPAGIYYVTGEWPTAAPPPVGGPTLNVAATTTVSGTLTLP